MRRTALIGLVALLGLAPGAGPAMAEIDGHGPDAWRVTGVARDDVLNMRMGPGTQYLAIDSLAPDARGLRQITCVPLLIPQIAYRLSEAQRAALPQRWCLVQTADLAKAGWVAQRFITEDSAAAPVPPGRIDATLPPVQSIGDPLIDGAARLVRDLYADFASATGPGDNPFAAGNAKRYFFADLVPELRGHGSDLLYGGQDFQGRITRIAPDAERPMFRGMITITVDLVNFGTPLRALFHLRADTQQPGAPFRIFSIEQDGWSFPE